LSTVRRDAATDIVLANLVASSGGSLSDSLTIPQAMANEPAGVYDLVATGSDVDGDPATASAPLVIGFDTTPPTLDAATSSDPLVISASTDAATEQTTITFSGGLTDDLSGVARIEVLGPGCYDPTGSTLSQVDGLDVHFTAVCVVSAYATLDDEYQLMITDAAGNTSVYSDTGTTYTGTQGFLISSLGYAADDLEYVQTSVTGPGDPTIDESSPSSPIALGATTATLDSSGDASSIPFTFGFSDPTAPVVGYNFVWANMDPTAVWSTPVGVMPRNILGAQDPSTGLCGVGGCIGQDTQPVTDVLLSGDDEAGTYRAHVYIPAGTLSGTYELVSVEIDDATGAETTYGTDSTSPALGSSLAGWAAGGVAALTASLGINPADMTFTVDDPIVTEPPIVTGPSFESAAAGGSVSLSTNSIDSASTSQEVDVTVSGATTDAGYDVQSISVFFTNEDDPEQFLEASCSRPVGNGCTMAVEIPAHADPGTWTLSMLYVTEATPDGLSTDLAVYCGPSWATPGVDPALGGLGLGYDPDALTFINSD
jgi:hypothetical protein